MKLETRTWKNKKWSPSPLPEMDSEQTLILVFAAPEMKSESALFTTLSSHYPSSHIIGCSTSGEIFNNELHDESITIAILEFSNTKIKQSTVSIETSECSFAAGSTIAADLYAEDLKSVFILSDGLHVNGTALANGINSKLGDNVIVTGGLAGDGDRFESTWILDRDSIKDKAITAIGLYGDSIQVTHGSEVGWDSFGPERLITRSNGNILYELDDKPALDLYKEYLGKRADGLPATALLFPLSLRTDSNDDKRIVRTILSVDEAENSMTFAGDIPQDHLATLMRTDIDRLVEGAESAALAALLSTDNPILSIAVSCVGRRLVLGESTEDEIEATLSQLPQHTQQVGFYSYGELSPYISGKCDLHNQTMTITIISEKRKEE